MYHRNCSVTPSTGNPCNHLVSRSLSYINSAIIVIKFSSTLSVIVSVRATGTDPNRYPRRNATLLSQLACLLIVSRF